MPGEKDLDKLLRMMKPTLNVGDYVFCNIKDIAQIDIADVIMFFRENEGHTIVLKKEFAEKLQLDYSFITSWITLTVHSSLEAVGLTAAFSAALAEENISCNVVAGYFHDHIFVDKRDAERALIILNQFSKK